MALTFLVGGARSGKSALAVRMASRWDGPVVFVATATASDEEFAARIARHRGERPASWTTVEEPRDLGRVLSEAPADACLVVDCLTLWVSNLMLHDVDDDEICRRAHEDARAAAARRSPTIAVGNEVGSGIVPENALARRFRDVLGAVNATWASAAESSALVVAGRVLPLAAPETLW